VPTIHQRAGLRINDDTAIGFMPGEYIETLIRAGYGRVEFLLNTPTVIKDVPAWKVRKAREYGAVSWGVGWADSFSDPFEFHAFLLSERRRIFADTGLTFSGFVVNAEDGTEARDQGGEKWSRHFLDCFRTHPETKKLALHLDTYIGCGGLELPYWQKRGARLTCQTHHESQTHEWPIDGYVTWANAHGWKGVATIKPEFGVYNPKPNRADQIAAAKRAGTIGFTAYYAEAAGDPKEHLIPLLNEARAAGVCA
jgi:hypothetical protein